MEIKFPIHIRTRCKLEVGKSRPTHKSQPAACRHCSEQKYKSRSRRSKEKQQMFTAQSLNTMSKRHEINVKMTRLHTNDKFTAGKKNLQFRPVPVNHFHYFHGNSSSTAGCKASSCHSWCEVGNERERQGLRSPFTRDECGGTKLETKLRQNTLLVIQIQLQNGVRLFAQRSKLPQGAYQRPRNTKYFSA